MFVIRWSCFGGYRICEESEGVCSRLGSVPLWKRRSGCVGTHVPKRSVPGLHAGKVYLIFLLNVCIDSGRHMIMHDPSNFLQRKAWFIFP